MDQLLQLIFFGLLLTGLTYILTKSVIFKIPRITLVLLFSALPPAVAATLTVLLYCPACASFWFGVVLAKMHLWPLKHVLWGNLDAAISSCGFIAVVMDGVGSDMWESEHATVLKILQGDSTEDSTHGQA